MKNFHLFFKMIDISVNYRNFIEKNIKASMLFIFLLFTAPIIVSAQTIEPVCGADLKSISSLDNSASESEETLDYLLTIENIGNSGDAFQLITENIKHEGDNPDGSDVSGNIDVKSAIIDEQGNLINKVSLQPGEKADIILRIFIPGKVKTGVWNRTQIKAVSMECGTETTIMYSTFIPKPESGSVGYLFLTDPKSELLTTAFNFRK